MVQLFAKDAFDGKSILVTGATSGIGEGTAIKFTECGGRVMLTGRNEERGEAVRETIRKAGGTAEFLAGDVSDAAFCDRLVAHTAKTFGRLDILFNNAGVFIGGAIDEVSDEDWHKMIDANLNGHFYMGRATVRQMKKQGGGGAIVNMGSEAGLVSYPAVTAYGASKAAIIHLTRGMAADCAADGIRVNVICPGDVDTPMHRAVWAEVEVSEEEKRRMAASIVPLGRISTVDDIANGVLYLASDAAAMVTGTALSVDGGTVATRGWAGGE
jgi:NAD(P)-dependent dehydrogenase (short-subunit alcohol dehydrogenase family)